MVLPEAAMLLIPDFVQASETLEPDGAKNSGLMYTQNASVRP